MATRVTISVPNDDKEIVDWVERKVEDRRFRNASEAFREGIKELMDKEKSDYNV